MVLDVVAAIAADIPGVGQALEVTAPSKARDDEAGASRAGRHNQACSHPNYTPV